MGDCLGSPGAAGMGLDCLEVNEQSQIRAVSGRVPPSNTTTTSVALNMSLAQGEYNKVGRSRPRKMIHWL